MLELLDCVADRVTVTVASLGTSGLVGPARERAWPVAELRGGPGPVGVALGAVALARRWRRAGKRCRGAGIADHTAIRNHVCDDDLEHGRRAIDAGAIASLNTATTVLEIAMPVARFAGVVEVSVGATVSTLGGASSEPSALASAAASSPGVGYVLFGDSFEASDPAS